MITCQQFEAIVAKGRETGEVTNAEMMAVGNHPKHCATCRDRVIAHMKDFMTNRSEEHKRLVIGRAIQRINEAKMDPESY